MCGRNADIFFVRLHRIFEGILSYGEKIMCNMTENLQVYDVQSLLTCFVRCCLKNKFTVFLWNLEEKCVKFQLFIKSLFTLDFIDISHYNIYWIYNLNCKYIIFLAGLCDRLALFICQTVQKQRVQKYIRMHSSVMTCIKILYHTAK